MDNGTFIDQITANSVLHWSDYVVLILYFIVVIIAGIGSSCINRGSVGGYFLAGRSMNWVLVGASLFASNIGSGHFIGLAGSGAATGIGISIFEFSAIYILLLLGWVFVPVYISSGVYTMPEYLKKRFGGERIRVYLGVLAVLLYVFTKISADLFAGAVFIKQSIGWDVWGSIIALLILSMLFTIAGGLSAVIWTDFVQVFIMVIGAFVLMGISFVRIAGYKGIEEKFLGPPAWSNFTREYVEAQARGDNLTALQSQYGECGKTPPNSFHLMRSANDGALPWPGVTIGLTISSIWYWCSDQVIVQRALASKNMSHVKAGCILAGCLKILPLFLMVFPGMISRLLFPDEVGCAEPSECERICGNRGGCTNIAYPLLVVKLMPDGARGLMLAVMMSALMSSLTSIFNSSSTIFTMDIWRRIRKNATPVELMIVGRVFVLVIVGISIAWIPIIQNISELFHYIQGITSFLAPPVCAVYVLAVSWKRINEQGAFWGLMVGLLVGMIRFIWEYSYGAPPPCGEVDTRHVLISKVHYLHFGIILFVISMCTTIIITLLTKPIDNKHLIRMTYHSRFEEGERIDIDTPANKQEIDGAVIPMSEINGAEPQPEVENGSDVEASTVQLDVKDEKATVERKQPIWKRGMYWICGIERMMEGDNQIEEMDMSIDEDPFWSQVTNSLAVLLMIGTAFLWGYYA